MSRLLAQGVLMLACSLFFAGCGVFGGTDVGLFQGDDDAIERTAEKGPVKMVVRVAPAEPRLSDLVQMDVTVESQPEVDIKPPAFGEAVGDFLIRDYSERPARAGERNVRRFHYQLEPAHAGKHLIRSVSVEFIDRRPTSDGRGESALVETEPIEVSVSSELGDDAPNLANLEPMLPPRPLPQPPFTGWLWAAGAGVVALGLVVWAVRRKKRAAALPRRRTPEEIAQAALDSLLAENLPTRGMFKEFYLRLTGVVREYIEGTTGIRAPEQTTEEFLRDMRSREAFPPQRSTRLAEFLEAADMVKYAGQKPADGEVNEATSRAREFVRMTASDESRSMNEA